jgi:histidinol dehydrogenase
MSETILREFAWSQLTAAEQRSVLARPAPRAADDLMAKVREIIAAVRKGGDDELRRLTARLDGVELTDLQVGSDEIASARENVTESARRAMAVAIENVRRFHAAQRNTPIRVETTPGVVCERVTRPITAVGLYVPAGGAPLPSTAIMLAVPAELAACPTRVLCTPPRRDGRADPGVLVAATACGIRQIFKVGGAQAIAAMAYGTQTIPKVDKILGPGNSWVTAAKQLVAMDPEGAAFDMPAGPSEVMVIADATANPRHVAYDLLSQAEHGEDSQVILVTTDPKLPEAVLREVMAALPGLPRRQIIERALRHASMIVVEGRAAALEIADRYAPEHLILQVTSPRSWVDEVRHAGSVFLGAWTPESVGDYCSGTNHVLPTYGYARTYSGLSLSDFERRMTIQELTAGGLTALAGTVTTLAELEGLQAHAEAVRVRLDMRPETCA